MLQSKKTLVAQGNYAPVAVTVAGIGIIATCVLSLVMLLWDLGLSSFGGWIGSSAESWDSTLVLLAALVILCFEVRCGVAVIAGKNWGRWGYLLAQGAISGYMLLASFSDFLPDIFHFSGETSWDVLHQFATQRLPDVLVIFLLFVPHRSRRYFQRYTA